MTLAATRRLEPDLLDELAASSQEARLESPAGPLPLVAVEASTAIAGLIATTRYSQRFVNPTTEHLEVTYVFPLPSRAAVGEFEAVLGGRRITGVLKERSQARADYAQAVAENRRAALAEQERPDVFTTTVGNIAPGEEATISLVVTGPLAVEDAEATFRFPLVTGIRYTEGAALDADPAGTGTGVDTDAVPDASRLNPPRLAKGQPRPELHFSVRIDQPGVAPDAVATSHPMTITGSPGAVGLALSDEVAMASDLLVRFALSRKLTTQALFADDPSTPTTERTSGTWSVTLVPPRSDQVAPRDVVVVLDRSGSMGGWKMVAARRAAARLVDTLDAADRFCVIGFDTALDVFSASPDSAATPEDPLGNHATSLLQDVYANTRTPALSLCPATDKNRFAAVRWLSALEARGGTRMAEPLVAATRLLAATRGDREPVVVLVTDGQISGEARLLEALEPSIGRTRFCVVGIDRLPNTGLLERLARRPGGYATFVESEARLDAALVHLHRRIGRPDLLDVVVTAPGADIELLRAETAPGRTVDAFSGVPCIITGRYRRTGRKAPRLTVTARAADGEEYSTTLVAKKGPAAGIAATWARARIADLEDAYDAGRDRAARDRIVALSIARGVLSRFTAFVAVDDERQEIAGTSSVVQPVESPGGWTVHQMASLRAGTPRSLGALSNASSTYSADCFAGVPQSPGLLTGASWQGPDARTWSNGPATHSGSKTASGGQRWDPAQTYVGPGPVPETAATILAECVEVLAKAKETNVAPVADHARRLSALGLTDTKVMAALSALWSYLAGMATLAATRAKLERILTLVTPSWHPTSALTRGALPATGAGGSSSPPRRFWI